ncbi:DUF4249 domain-containing protein [Carboxylicivirga taeanensis]|uniref:DUF4249 domain-containing protein n=1 Tax=Carboxylicivirga taeanensis TaxID=1416875 RepID=UPI003F6DA56B
MRRILYILLALLLIACEKDIEIELNAQSDKLVMYTFIYPDSTLNFHLSKSQSILSLEDYQHVDKGRFQLFVNDDFQGAYILPSDTIWSSWPEFNFEPGDAVRINAYELNGDTVKAQTYIPKAVELAAMDTVTIVRDVPDNGIQKMLKVSLRFEDPPGENNYYQVIAVREGWGDRAGEPYFTQETIVYDKDDAVFTQGEQSGSLLPGLDFQGLFTDGVIDGKAYTFTLYIPTDDLFFDYYEDKIRITFYLYHHTSDYFSYFRSIILADGYEGFYEGLPVFEPVKIYSNVQNGLGLVSGMNFDSDSLVFVK